MRRAIEKEEGFQEGQVVEVWSKKRIVIALVIFSVLVGVLMYGLQGIGQSSLIQGLRKQEILGEKSSDDVKLPTKADIENMLMDIKGQLELITTENITSSTAAIQKIIQDLETVQGGSKEPKDVFCELVCKNR